jgi:hypothetical protein
MTLLLTASDLPDGFTYPLEFIRVVELGLIELEPWRIMGGDDLRLRVEGLRRRYPEHQYIPFARRINNDDVACWDASSERARVQIIHDFASAGWEHEETLPDFNQWLRQAVEDFIEWGTSEGSSD